MNKKVTQELMDMQRPHGPGYKKISDLEMLRQARELLRGRWTQGSNALDVRGLPIAPTDSRAVCYCLRGACINVLQPTHTVLTIDLHVDTSRISKQINRALGFASGPLLVQWNDTQSRTEAEVIALINNRLTTLRKDKRHGELSETVG